MKCSRKWCSKLVLWVINICFVSSASILGASVLMEGVFVILVFVIFVSVRIVRGTGLCGCIRFSKFFMWSFVGLSSMVPNLRIFMLFLLGSFVVLRLIIVIGLWVVRKGCSVLRLIFSALGSILWCSRLDVDVVVVFFVLVDDDVH